MTPHNTAGQSIPDRMYEAQKSTWPATLTREQMHQLFATAQREIIAETANAEQVVRDPKLNEIWMKQRTSKGRITHRLILITKEPDTHFRDVHWQAIDGSPGPKSGRRSLHYWHDDCTFVADSYEQWAKTTDTNNS